MEIGEVRGRDMLQALKEDILGKENQMTSYKTDRKCDSVKN